MAGVRATVVGLVLFLGGMAAGAGAVVGWQHLHRPPLADLPPKRCEATIYLPVVDNDGRRIGDEDWRQAVAGLVADFGGATLGAEQEGWWVDDRRQVHREPVRLVVISFERQRLPEFRAGLRDLGRRLGQEELYVRLEEPHIELLPVGGVTPEKGP
jgi:hypothetical protein